MLLGNWSDRLHEVTWKHQRRKKQGCTDHASFFPHDQIPGTKLLKRRFILASSWRGTVIRKVWQPECPGDWSHCFSADKEQGRAVKPECLSLKVPPRSKTVPTPGDRLFTREPLAEACIHTTAEPLWRMLWDSFCLRNTALPP